MLPGVWEINLCSGTGVHEDSEAESGGHWTSSQRTAEAEAGSQAQELCALEALRLLVWFALGPQPEVLRSLLASSMDPMWFWWSDPQARQTDAHPAVCFQPEASLMGQETRKPYFHNLAKQPTLPAWFPIRVSGAFVRSE